MTKPTPNPETPTTTTVTLTTLEMREVYRALTARAEQFTAKADTTPDYEAADIFKAKAETTRDLAAKFR